MLAGSIVMDGAVLLTRNHYTVDVISAYFMGYAIFVLSERLYFHYLRPLFLSRPPGQVAGAGLPREALSGSLPR